MMKINRKRCDGVGALFCALGGRVLSLEPYEALAVEI